MLALLRRFAVEAAREEARMFCDDLVARRLHHCRPISLYADGTAGGSLAYSASIAARATGS